jgi:hypothetical protein
MLFFKLALVSVLFVAAFAQFKLEDAKNAFKPLWDSLSDEQKKDVTDLLNDKSLTKAEVTKKMDALVKKFADEKITV